jgi:hypothetical protein
MANSEMITGDELKSITIQVYEPFADFLLGTEVEKNFEISLLDTVRFAGHACPSIVGAFLITQRAVNELWPDTKICVRGDLHVELPGAPTEGPTGPIANVFGYITGAWGETGFGGLRGQFARRNLIKFSVQDLPSKSYRFTKMSDGSSVIVHYDPDRIPIQLAPQESFQQQWRRKITACLKNPELVTWTNKSI